ncbi:MAG: Bacterial rane protein YfhO, partial [Myxococcaceae bacterium]|nr:Bacterial rane protein YfhO [Myxococcaceae bacterium]
ALGLLLVLPYARLLTFRAVNLADDVFVADLLGGELPFRAAIGRALRAGQLPLWEPRIYSGYPLFAGGGALDPIGGALFAALPPAAAYDAFLLVMLAVAGFGAARLARVLGATAAGAVLTGLAWAHGGVVVSQWRHLGVLGTIAWLPLGLSLVEDALGPRADGARRDRALALFAGLLGLQTLAAFPQSLYACLLAYGLWAVVRTLDAQPGARARLAALARFTLACMLGLGLGAVQLLPMAEFGALSSRHGGLSWEAATHWRLWPPHLLGMLVPYPFGDVSDQTYRGRDLFWESHAYLGLATVPLALVALAADRRRAVVTLGVVALLGVLFALGPSTPVYRVAFAVLPGLDSFRIPQRFLFVACAALATLAGLGLTRAQRWWSERAAPSRLSAAHLGAAAVALVAIDLGLAEPRQNPLVDAAPWLRPPAVVGALAGESVGRVYSMDSSAVHQHAFALARGWSDLAPYRVARELIQPDANLFWSLATPDGYAGLITREMEFSWGAMGPRHDGLARGSYATQADQLVPAGGFVRYLAMNHVTHVLAPAPVTSQRLDPLPSGSWTRLYRVREPLPLAYFVAGAVAVPDDRAAARLIFSDAFSPRREVLLHAAPAGTATSPQPGPASLVAASITRPSGDALTATVDAPTAGWLVLAESWYPGWTAAVDGRPADLVRANINQKAVAVPAGSHRVSFALRPRSLARGAAVSAASLACLAAAALWIARRKRPDQRPSVIVAPG